MLIVGIDTSTTTGSVALRDNSSVIGVLTVNVDTTHSVGLMPAIDTLLERAARSIDEITAVACVKGPGSYTGLRVGIATAQGLAFGKNTAGLSFSSLEVLSWSLPHSRHPICPMIPARKGWMYAQIFSWQDDQPTPLTDELYLQPEELIHHITEPTIFMGPGLPPFQETLQGILQTDALFLPPAYNLPRADILTELAFRAIQHGKTCKPHEMQPHYLGASQAEINWKRIHGKSAS